MLEKEPKENRGKREYADECKVGLRSTNDTP